MKFIILGAIVALIIDAVIARKFFEIAEMKGRDGSSYFWFTFLLVSSVC